MADLNGNGRHEPPTFMKDIIEAENRNVHDPGAVVPGMPPGMGRYPITHISTFQGFVSTVSHVYRDFDESLKHSLDNARYMRNDVGIMECLEARQRGVALLNWHLEPEDENSTEQKHLVEELTTILKRMKRFTEYRYNLLHALWYGRYAVQHRYAWQNVRGYRRIMPTRERENPGWLPINGDKLVFRFQTNRLQENQWAHQIGIRVGGGHHAGQTFDERWKVEATDRGLAYFLSDYERRVLALHKHSIEDGAWEDPLSGGMIHGVGIRSRIYWEWFMMQETKAFLMEYLERSAGGIELWKYPLGNDKAKEQTETAAKERIGGGRNVMLVPVPPGEEGYQYGVEVIEPGMAGIDALERILTQYHGHRIKRYILGQILSSEAEATGLGSGVADLHYETYLQILRYDATNLEETLTDDLVTPIKDWNFPKAKSIPVRFVIDTEKADQESKLKAYEAAWSMGAAIKEADVFDVIGASMPDENDKVLKNPQMEQAAAQADMMRNGQFPGMPGDFNGRSQVAVPDPQRDYQQLAAMLTGEQDRGVVGRIQNGKYRKTDDPENCGTGSGGFQPGNTCATSDKVKTTVKRIGDRWYAMADLPGGRQITRSHESESKALQLAQQDIRTAGFEPHVPKDERQPDHPGLFSPGDDLETAPPPLQPTLPGASEPQTKLRKGQNAGAVGATVMSVSDIDVDPSRFQYKIAGIDPKTGVTRELKGVEAWNPILAGIITVWQDPANGKTYVINGHHRVELAKRAIGRPLSQLLPGMAHDPQFADENGNYNGAMQVMYLDARDAKSARAMGALANIAEGRGSAIDAAKFLRDTGQTAEQLGQYGVSLKGTMALRGSVLAGLSDSLFDRLTTGRMTEGRAMAIGEHLPDKDKQNELWGLIQKAEERRDVTDSTIAEMARELAITPTRRRETGGLFDDFMEQSLIAERAELKAHLRRSLSSEARAFKEASSTRRQETLESTGRNVLDVTGNREMAQTAAEAVYDFDTRVNAAGDPLAIAVSEAAEEFADVRTNKERNEIKRGLSDRIRAILGSESERGRAGSPPTAAGGGSGLLPASETGRPVAAQREQFRRLMAEARDLYGLSDDESVVVEQMVRDQMAREMVV